MPRLALDHLVPTGIRACLFDMDGVLTRTADVHASAWKRMFDDFLRDRAERSGVPFRPFELPADYTAFVDGRLRGDGVREFLASRDIALAEGEPTDTAAADTVHGLGTRKNELVLSIIRGRGVGVYEGSVGYARAVRDAGLPRAIVSASRNCAEVLAAAGIADLFQVRVDGVVAAASGLRGKPAPDMFLAAATALGVDRVGQAAELARGGADIVVSDLGELLEQR